MNYDNHYAQPNKQEYLKNKASLDKNYLFPLIDSNKNTLNVGAGYFVEKDLLKIKKIICGDIDATALKHLKAKGNETVYLDAKGNFPFKDNQFEQILVLEVIEHLGQIDFFVSELKRVLKEDGFLIISCPLLNHWKNRLALLKSSTKNVLYDEHPRLFFDSDIKRIFTTADFVLIKSAYVGLTKGFGYYKFKKEGKE